MKLKMCPKLAIMMVPNVETSEGTVMHQIPVMYPYFGHLQNILPVSPLQENEAIKLVC